MEPVFFSTAEEWDLWLASHHQTEKEIWVGYHKSGSAKTGITYGESLDGALCWGWVDGRIRSLDEVSYQRRFTPRKAGSVWSAANVAHVERLTREGRMRPPGVAAVEAAKASGRWQAAYQGQKSMAIPPDLAGFLAENPQVKAFYDHLSSANRYAFLYRLETSRTPEARVRKFEVICQMLSAGETYH